MDGARAGRRRGVRGSRLGGGAAKCSRSSGRLARRSSQAATAKMRGEEEPQACTARDVPAGGGGKLPGLSRKLFQKGSSSDAAAGKKTKALTEAKNGGNNANTRTLAMVLRSERELLAQSRAQEDEIAALRLQLGNKDREVERHKDLCLRQREEIRTLKGAVLFPDAGAEPDCRLRDEISTLTGQIQCLAQELTQVKAKKHSPRSCFDDGGYCSSPGTPVFNEETAFSLECTIGKAETPNCGSPNEMLSKDLNPCLTPCIAKSKSDVSAQIQSSSHFTKYGPVVSAFYDRQIPSERLPELFGLPSTIFDIDIEVFQQKPWRLQGVDLTDYFNFNLDEESWRKYWCSMKQLRLGTRPRANGTS